MVIGVRDGNNRGEIAYHILKRISKDGETGYMDGSAYANKSKLETVLGSQFWQEIENKTVMDFGCGAGAEAVEMAERGACKVVGIDIQESLLELARQHAARAGVSERCVFSTHAAERVDVIVAIDSFEHFEDPAAILQMMRDMLKPAGCVMTSFGPTWYHPLGGHLFRYFRGRILFSPRRH